VFRIFIYLFIYLLETLLQCVTAGHVLCDKYEFATLLDRVNRRDRFLMKKQFRSSARGASFHTKHASNANDDRVVLDANSYWAL
jgi:hypothetical protein